MQGTPCDLQGIQGTIFYSSLNALVVRLTISKGMFVPELQDLQSNHQTVKYYKLTARIFQVLKGVMPDSLNAGMLTSAFQSAFGMSTPMGKPDSFPCRQAEPVVTSVAEIAHLKTNYTYNSR